MDRCSNRGESSQRRERVRREKVRREEGVRRERISRKKIEVKMLRTPQQRGEADFQVKMVKTPHVRSTFRRSSVVFCGSGNGFCTLSKNDGRLGTFELDLQRCIVCGRRSPRDMSIRHVRRSRRWFPGRGCILEHQIFRFAKTILRDRCSTSHDLASLFRGRCSTLDRWNGNIATH